MGHKKYGDGKESGGFDLKTTKKMFCFLFVRGGVIFRDDHF